jgi:hypothetical protein
MGSPPTGPKGPGILSRHAHAMLAAVQRKRIADVSLGATTRRASQDVSIPSVGHRKRRDSSSHRYSRYSPFIGGPTGPWRTGRPLGPRVQRSRSWERLPPKPNTRPTQKSNRSIFALLKITGLPRITSLPCISIWPNLPACKDAAPACSLFCASSVEV